MKKWHKWLGYIFMSAITMVMVSGCGKAAEGDPKGDTFTVGYANSADSDVFDKKKRDVFEQVVSKDSSINVKYADANMDIQKQLDQVDNFIAQKVNLLVLVPCDYAGITPAVEKANAAGIPVICLGIASEGGEYTFVGSQNSDAGKMQGEFMVEKLPQNAKILYISGTPGLAHSTDRHDGFMEAISIRSDIQVLTEQTGMYERAKGMQVMEDWIQSFSEFDAVVAGNDQMALGALEALKGANRLKGVLISGVDGTADACNAIKNGEMAQSIFQSAPGLAQACYDTILKIQNGEPIDKEIIVPFESITAENVENYSN